MYQQKHHFFNENSIKADFIKYLITIIRLADAYRGVCVGFQWRDK